MNKIMLRLLGHASGSEHHAWPRDREKSFTAMPISVRRHSASLLALLPQSARDKMFLEQCPVCIPHGDCYTAPILIARDLVLCARDEGVGFESDDRSLASVIRPQLAEAWK